MFSPEATVHPRATKNNLIYFFTEKQALKSWKWFTNLEKKKALSRASYVKIKKGGKNECLGDVTVASKWWTVLLFYTYILSHNYKNLSTVSLFILILKQLN